MKEDGVNYYEFCDAVAKPHLTLVTRLIDSMVDHWAELRVFEKFEEADALRKRLARFHVIIEAKKAQPVTWRFE